MSTERMQSSDEEKSRRGRKKSSAKVELIEIDGKTVSKTATGKRKFHKKSKNGCAHCKRRRVKCDETRPHCLNCKKMNLDCVYTPVQPRSRKNSTTTATKASAKVEKPTVASSPADALSINQVDILVNTMKAEAQLHQNQQEQEQQVPQQPQLQPHPLKRQVQHEIITAKNSSAAMSGLPKQGSTGAAGATAPVGTPGAAGSTAIPENVHLPPLAQNPHFLQHLQQQIQQQPYLLPQLMTLTNSEKFAAQFEVPNSPSTGTLQSQPMNISNSIASLLAGSKIPSNLSSNPLALFQQLTQSPQRPNAKMNNAGNPLSNLGGFNLKQLGTFPTAGIGGVTYDFQELLGLKSALNSATNDSTTATVGTDPSKQDTAVEVLAGLQMKQEKFTNSLVHYSLDLNTRNLPNNPTISPAAPMSPLNKLNDGQTSLNSATKSVSENGTSIANGVATDMSKVDTQDSESTNGTTSSRIGSIANMIEFSTQTNLNLVDLKLFHHYCTKVWPTISAAGISEKKIWAEDVPEIAFEYPFLMHSLLAFSATHLSRTESGLERYVTQHRLEALRLLREAVLEINEANTDALVASAIILIMDSLANAATPVASGVNSPISAGSLSASAWIFHVKGAATILTAVWPLTEKSRFYNLINVDLSDMGDIINQENGSITELVCFDESIADLYPVEINSPYLITLAYLDKLNKEKGQPGFILRVFAFPALLDKTFLALLMTGDLGAMRIMRSYYQLLRGFASEMKDQVWFLEGITQVLPQDVDEYSGGGGMHMMLDFLGGGLPSMTTTNLSDFGIF